MKTKPTKNLVEISLYPVKLYIYKGHTDKQFYKELKKDSKGMASDKFINGMFDNDSMLACVDSFKNHIVIKLYI